MKRWILPALAGLAAAGLLGGCAGLQTAGSAGTAGEQTRSCPPDAFRGTGGHRPAVEVVQSTAPRTCPPDPQALCGAREAFQRATRAGAETKAPYEYYASEAYLAFAEDESTEADEKAAGEFGATAQHFAEQALSKAGGGAR